MKRNIKIASTVLAVTIALAIGIILYENETLVSTQQLRTQGFEFEPVWTTASFYSGKTDVADVSVTLGEVEPQQGLAYMTFYIDHTTGTLDSFYLEFTPQYIMYCYMQPPNYPASITKAPDGLSTIVEANNLGSYGVGTLGLEFYLQPYETDSFGFQVNFTVTPSGSPQTRQVGTAQVQLPLTYANATDSP
jgi:hypothetical protein